MSKAKFKAGKRIESIGEFEQCPNAWYKLRGRTVHRSFLMSQQYRTLFWMIMRGELYEAEYTPEAWDALMRDLEKKEK